MDQAPTSMRDILLSLARLQYLLGEQLVAVGPVAPDLAASLSSVAVSQTTFGHARFFYNWRAGESRAADADLTAAGSWETERSLLPFSHWNTWVHLITALWAVDIAMSELVRQWTQYDQALAGALEKMSEELDSILLFTGDWVRIFISDTPGVRAAALQLLEELGPALSAHISRWEPEAARRAQKRWAELSGLVA